MRRKRFSIARSMTIIILALAAAVIVLMNLVGVYSGRELLMQANDNAQATIDMAGQGLDEQLLQMEGALNDEASNDIHFKYLADSYSANEIFKYSEQVRRNLDSYLAYNNLSYYTLIFHTKDERIHASNTAKLSSEKAAALYEAIQKLQEFPNKIETEKWTILETEKGYYLMRMIRYESAFIGILVYLDDWTVLENGIRYQTVALSWKYEGLILAQNEEAMKNSEGNSDGRRSDKVSLSWESSEVPLSLECEIQKGEIMGRAGEMQQTIVIFSLLLCFFLPFILLLLRRHLLAPLKMLNDKIEDIRNGKMTVASEEVRAKEAREIVETFDRLMVEINELKIAKYEEELSAQQYKMQYLMLQLKPHFYLNFLKAVYALAEEKKYNEIQQMTRYMSEYFRYVIYTDSSTVTLKEELEHVRNYVKIQQMGHAFTIVCNMNLDSDVMELAIPTLSVQTFVENSVKYANMEGTVLKIDIKISRIEDDESSYLDLVVMDNGVGYSDEILKEFESGGIRPEAGRHAGLNNLNKRLQLMYGDRAYMILQNGMNKGAVSEIILPIVKEQVEV